MSNEKILVVDDEEDILELVKYNLTREGYRIVYTETGEDAVKKARSEGPDLIVLDLMLPGIDGLEVCRQLKSDPATRHVPIVMLTAKGEEADMVAGLELGRRRLHHQTVQSPGPDRQDSGRHPQERQKRR